MCNKVFNKDELRIYEDGSNKLLRANNSTSICTTIDDEINVQIKRYIKIKILYNTKIGSFIL